MDSLVFFASLVISSFPKLFYVLMVIWDYQELKYSWTVKMFVFASNIVALNGKNQFEGSFESSNLRLVCIRGDYWQASLLLFVAFAFNLLIATLAEHLWSL